MSILVVGSVGLDDVKTHVGQVENALGGSAIYFSTAASFFYDSIRLVAVVGDDFPQEHLEPTLETIFWKREGLNSKVWNRSRVAKPSVGAATTPATSTPRRRSLQT